MAHLVETMMYVGETPWHGLGKTIPEEKKLSIDEAIVAACLDWVVDRRPMFTEYNKGLKLKVEVPGCYAMC
jgi:hypothetical protein